MEEGASHAVPAVFLPHPFISAQGPPLPCGFLPLLSQTCANATVNPTLDGFYTHRLVFPPSSLSPCTAPSQRTESGVAPDLDLCASPPQMGRVWQARAAWWGWWSCGGVTRAVPCPQARCRTLMGGHSQQPCKIPPNLQFQYLTCWN